MQTGREQYEEAIDKVIECEQSNRWPGVAEDEVVAYPSGLLGLNSDVEGTPMLRE